MRSADRAQVLVPDYIAQHTVAGMRSLATGGARVDLAWPVHRLHQLLKSRAIRKIKRIRAADVDDRGFAEDVLALADNYDAVVPFSLVSYYALVRHQELLAGKVPCLLPDWQQFERVHDKYQASQLCKELGVAIPRSFPVACVNDLEAVAREAVFPLVIKAVSGTGVDQGVRYANTAEELRRGYDAITAGAAATGASNFEQLVVQEFIPGYIHDACTVSHQGRAVAVVTQKREVMYPIYGGVGAQNITTDEPQLRDLVCRILEACEWSGPAQLEFKRDPRDGVYKFIEFNPKFWGTLDLSIQAGVAFPRIVSDLIRFGENRQPVTYAPGVRYRFWLPQLLLARLQNRRLPDSSGMRRLPPCTALHNDLAWHDPAPELFRVIKTTLQWLKRGADSPLDNLDPLHVPYLETASSPTDPEGDG